MKKFVIQSKRQREAVLQEKIVRMLRIQEWIVIPTHGNKFQAGFPDLYCFHHVYGERWIEIKVPGEESFTEYQAYYFPLIRNVWVLTGTSNIEYAKLFKDPNYSSWIGRSKEAKKKDTIVQRHREGIIQYKVQEDLEKLGHTVMPTYGNNIQKGLPDLLVLKRTRRQWLELKRYNSFTPAQIRNFPRMHSCKIGIWILDVSSSEYDLTILDRPANLKDYL